MNKLGLRAQNTNKVPFPSLFYSLNLFYTITPHERTSSYDHSSSLFRSYCLIIHFLSSRREPQYPAKIGKSPPTLPVAFLKSPWPVDHQFSSADDEGPPEPAGDALSTVCKLLQEYSHRARRIGGSGGERSVLVASSASSAARGAIPPSRPRRFPFLTASSVPSL